MANNPTNRPLRIGYIWQYKTANLTTFSATALHVKAVIQKFRQHGHKVRMISYYQGKAHWSDDLEKWHPIEPVIRPKILRVIESILRGIQSRLKLPYFNFFNSYRFADACQIAGKDCDVFYERFWLLASGAGMAAKRLGIPILYEVNGDLVEEYHQQNIELSKVQWSAIHYVTRRMFENAGQVITVSETLKQKTIQRWKLKTKNVSAIENGAHVELFATPDPKQVAAEKASYPLNRSQAIIFVGTFKPWHGVDLLVNAFKQIAPSHPETKLLLVGDGPLRKELEADVDAHQLKEQIIFTGLVKHQQVPALLNLADIAVLNPRLSKASASQSPLKLFEYMAAGKAIIAPINANTQRILTHNETGLLIPPDDPEALKEALETLLDKALLRKELGMAARKQALKKHSWDQTVSEIEAIMYNLINNTTLDKNQTR